MIEGDVPAGAIKGGTAMAATRGLQFLQGVGIVITTYDLEQAAIRSVDTHSVRPFAGEAIRQSSGWAGAMLGARLGAAGDALIGIETGPGAVLTSAGGAIMFGVAGYFGAAWVSELIDRHAKPVISPPPGPFTSVEDWDHPNSHIGNPDRRP